MPDVTHDGSLRVACSAKLNYIYGMVLPAAMFGTHG
jgi:hypothetical protein